MTELGATGSLLPGRGTPAIFESAARPNELRVTSDVRAAWGALTHLVAHADNRMDADYPNSHPPYAAAGPTLQDPEIWRPYASYLAADASAEVSLPEPAFLMPRQQEAFDGMRAAMRSLEGIDREAFAAHFMGWVTAAHLARSRRYAIGVPSAPQYLAWRRKEGEHLAAMFAGLVPPNDRGPRFDRYARFMTRMGVAAKLGDSAIDLPKDIRGGTTQLYAVTPARILAGAVAAKEVTRVLATRPRLLVPIGQKALLFAKNRLGSRNAMRTQ